MIGSLTLIVLLCLIVGAAIDTGNVCVVQAAGNLAKGQPAIAISSLATLACASIVFYLNTQLNWHRQMPSWSYPTLATCLGSALFSAGALVNGACAIGTIGRLARGDIGYLATFLGGLGVVQILPESAPVRQAPEIPALSGLNWLLIVLACCIPILIVWRRHLKPLRLASYALIGLAAAAITAWQGDWTWLNAMREIGAGVSLGLALPLLVGTVFIGALATALYRHHFRFVRPDPGKMLREALGGGLMTAGAILIPGGNDALLVYGVPSGDPRSVVGYAEMFLILVLAFRLGPWWQLPAAKPAEP